MTCLRISTMAVCVLTMVVAGCDLFKPATGPDRRLFVSNYGDDTISVIEGDPEREVKTISVGDSPKGLAINTTIPLLAVANSTGSQVTLIDPVGLEVLRKLEVGPEPEDVAFSRDGKTLFVSLPTSKQVVAVSVDSGKPAGEPITLDRKPLRMVMSPDGTRLYVALYDESGGVAVVNTTTLRVEATIPVGRYPTGIGLSGDGHRLLTAGYDDGTVTVVDTGSLQPIATHQVETGFGLVVNPTKPIAYSMASFDDEVDVLDFETGKVVATLELGKFPTYSVVAKDGKFLYLVHEDDNNVVKVDTETYARVLRIAVGAKPGSAVVFER